MSPRSWPRWVNSRRAQGRGPRAARAGRSGRDPSASSAGAKLARRPFAVTDQFQRADHRAHLRVEETAGAGADHDHLALAADIESVKRLFRRFRLAFGRAERGEIMLAEDQLCGAVHRLGIERHRAMPDAQLVERRAAAAVEDAIFVVPRDRGKPRLERLRHRRRLDDRHRIAAWCESSAPRGS